MSTKKRPGVEASMRLIKHIDSEDVVQLWETIESQIDDVYTTLFPPLQSHEASCEEMQQRIMVAATESTDTNSPCSITKEELLDVIIPWKFAVGKPRHALKKYLISNTDESVEEQSRLAISIAKEITSTADNDNAVDDTIISESMEPLLELAGVGPATASAIVTLVRPDIFCYMYDEVIDTFLPKRTYTLPIYLQIRRECALIATKLNTSVSSCSSSSMEKNRPKKQQKLSSNVNTDGDIWTPARVAKTLWIASKICAYNNNNNKKRNEQETNIIKDYTLNIETAGVIPISTKRTTNSNSKKTENVHKMTRKRGRGNKNSDNVAKCTTQSTSENRKY